MLFTLIWFQWITCHINKWKVIKYLLKRIYIYINYESQITGETVGEVRAVSGMHQRKAEMARQADAFIALPGINYYYCY